MEKKQLIIYSGIAVLGIGLVVGTVLFLRSRNAPADDQGVLVGPLAPKAGQTTGAKTNTASVKNQKGARPYTPIESYTIPRGWKVGDPPLKIDRSPTAAELIPNPSSTKPSSIK